MCAIFSITIFEAVNWLSTLTTGAYTLYEENKL